MSDEDYSDNENYNNIYIELAGYYARIDNIESLDEKKNYRIVDGFESNTFTSEVQTQTEYENKDFQGYDTDGDIINDTVYETPFEIALITIEKEKKK